MIESAQRMIVCTWRQSASPMPLFPPVTRMRCAITAYVRDSLEWVESRPSARIEI
jgi:hypothetical protein